MKKIIFQFTKKHVKWVSLVLLFAIFETSCKKDSPDKPEYPIGSNENINTWILDSLKRYYYWNEALPANSNISLNPKDFFAFVRNSADRFSYMVLPSDPSTYTQSNRNFGFDYAVVQEQSTAQVIGIVKLVLGDSPAARAGLKRGDYIRKINGQALTAANASALQQEVLSSNNFTLGLAELETSIWKETRTVEISKGVILDQREVSKIIQSDGRKIAYLYFSDFNPGLASSLNNTFLNFKNAAVTDLILDLRYNSGGQVAEAAALGAMIASGITYDKPFIAYKGNKNGGIKTESFGSAATFDGTVNFSTILHSNLGLSRIYILATAGTASASELMINNLKPYIQVVLVGEKTRGKDEASFKIVDQRSQKQVHWEMHPIIYKLYNASGNGDYSSGITPNISVNELAFLPLKSFGDITDPLLNAAISRITGKVSVVVKGALKSANTHDLTVNKVLLDTRELAADNSIVITHH